tara:strand:+ start:927 stop:1433 length:507 start_codon:yes stop_codon:yes gene_type:complete
MSNSRNTNTVIRVTPTLSTDAYGDNEVLFDATEIPHAVLGDNGCSKLLSLTILNQNVDVLDIDIVFMQVQTNLGTINAAIDISDSDAEAAKILATCKVDGSACKTGLNAQIIYTIGATSMSANVVSGLFPILLQANSGSTSVYFTAILRDATPTFAADDLDFIFHIEK